MGSPERWSAVKFDDEQDLRKALSLLEELSSKGPIEYDVIAGSAAVVFPRWVYEQTRPLLDRLQLHYKVARVTPLSELSPKKQAELRGLIWRSPGKRRS